MAVDCTVEI